MLAQTRRAIDKLKAAGFARSEYSVQAERNYCGKHPETGKSMYEYGVARIVLLCPRERQYTMIPAMLTAGLGVELYTYSGRDGYSTVSSPFVNNRHRQHGTLTVLHNDRTDKHGLMIREQIT